MLETIEIPQDDDCDTCQRRHNSDWVLLQSVRISTLGITWCSECGREYTAICAADDVAADFER